MLTRRAFLIRSSLALAGYSVLARRLLMAGGGSGAFAVPSGPPNEATWTRAVAYNPVLAADPGQWNGQSIDGPSALYVGGAWHGWYAGTGPSGTYMGAMDSADGLTWTWHLTGGLDIPVLGGGQGGLGVGVNCYQPNVDYFDGTYYYAFISDPTGTPANCLSVARSTDGYTWTDLTRNILAFATGIDQWNTASILKSGSTYYMVVEGHVTGTGNYHSFFATAANPMGPYTLGNSGNQLSSLTPAGCPGSSGPNLILMSDGRVHNYYHAGPSPTSDIYAGSIALSDFVAGSDTWTISNGGSAILVHSGVGDEVSQLADPCVVLVGSTWRLYCAAVWNQSPFQAHLIMATAPAT